ncbi:glycoside hydrolase superfamily [Stachybotrys elegans]|uniref:beta-glucosidase n=1 Tax=Stachybotrys elegans TaxID=80388 RepID=A0A8K0SDJ4_9HYPO|nr:glycoside hydrolase superfamily [Stachybotrys elegans]
MQIHQKARIDVEQTLQKLTLLEKVSLLSGNDFWHTTPIPDHQIPSVRCTDGPNGARGTRFFNPVPALCIPCGTGLGATWNAELMYETGRLLSRECEAKGAHVWLGPTVNLIRSPLNGRGFESFSEDPYLGGVLAGAIIRGVQSRGTLAALKHFVANDQETEKWSVDTCMSERALREVYLKPFQIAVAQGNPKVVMASYNRVNGTHVSENREILEGILRKEWGFDGLVMSDWFGTYSCAEALNAGLDLEMPGPSRHRGVQAVLAISSGKVMHHTVDERARNVLRFVNEAAGARVSETETTRDSLEDRKLNRLVASESVVLLKNDEKTLPLSISADEEVAVIGPNAKLPAACGGGSASLRPYYTSSVFNGIRDQLSPSTKLHYEPGVFGHILLPYFTDELVTDDHGQPGVSIELFSEPHGVPDRKSFDYLTIPDTTYQLMDYKHPSKPDTFYISMRANYVAEHSGTYEFGLATYGVGKLFINDELVIDNETEQAPGGMFFGKGSSEKRATYEVIAGQSYRLRVEAGSASTSKVIGGSLLPLPGGACRLGGCLKIDPAEGIHRAVALAEKCKHVFVVVGLNADLEKEGMDRQSMSLPPNVDELVSAVLAANPKAIVVTQAGNPIAMPWVQEAKTIVHSWYGGNEAGNAVADVIFGKVNPSGKLPVTFQKRLEDGPSALSFGSDNGRIYYAEDVFVGYRWFEARNIDVAFPFGHGLSYTSFAISNIRVFSEEVIVDIENTGAREGAEVLRLYFSFVETSAKAKSRFHRPKRTLAAFQKVHLKPGEKRSIPITLQRDNIAVWDVKRGQWCCEGGLYSVSVVTGEQSLEGSFTIDRDILWGGH